MSKPPASPQPGGTPRQRWIAAQRLAAGDPVVLAAAAADMLPEELEPLAEGDPWFRKLREACEALLALSPEAWASGRTSWRGTRPSARWSTARPPRSASCCARADGSPTRTCR